MKSKIGLVVNDDKTWQFVNYEPDGGANITAPIPWEIFMNKISIQDIRLIAMGKPIDYETAIKIFQKEGF